MWKATCQPCTHRWIGFDLDHVRQRFELDMPRFEFGLME